ncbi:unnamed protein product, partial [Chironomus riparius]
RLAATHWTYQRTSYVVSEVVIAIFAIIGNILVFLVFFRESKLRHKINFYIISLAIADFGIGMIGIPFGISVLSIGLPYHCSPFLCIVPISSLLTFCNTSVYSLVLISVKRLRILAMNHPKPKTKSIKNISKEIGMCWLIGFLIGFLPTIWTGDTDSECALLNVLSKGFIIFRFIFVVIIPSIIMFVVYFNIYKIIITQSQKTYKPDEMRKQKAMNREIRVTISISMIVLIYCLTWLPLQLVYLISALCKSCNAKKFITLTVCIAHLSSAINPMLYAYHMRDIRHAIFRLFRSDLSETSTSVRKSSVMRSESNARSLRVVSLSVVDK